MIRKLPNKNRYVLYSRRKYRNKKGKWVRRRLAEGTLAYVKKREQEIEYFKSR